MSTQPKAAQSKKLGLDKPCSMCGAAIYYNYRGPLEGICGKCTDLIRRRLAPRGGMPAGGRGGRGMRRGGGFGYGSLVLAFLCGAAAAVIVLLNGWLPVF